jgi:hypothetical protein
MTVQTAPERGGSRHIKNKLVQLIQDAAPCCFSLPLMVSGKKITRPFGQV